MAAAYRSPRSCDSRKTDRPTFLELADLAHLHQGPQHEVVNRVAFPGHAGAMLAEDPARHRRARCRPFATGRASATAKPRTISIMPRA